MCSLIEFGRWSPYYYYIIIMIIAKFIKEDILGFNEEFQPILELNIKDHSLMILLLGFISDFIISLLLHLYLNYKKRKKERIKSINQEDTETLKKSTSSFDNMFEFKDNKSKSSSDDGDENNLRQDSLFKRENTLKYYLIHNDVISMELDSLSKNSFKFIVLSAFLIVLKECVTKILYSSNDIFDYYFLNIIIIAIILRIFFKKKLYKHQIFSIILVSLISGSFLISCIFVNNNTESKENDGFRFTFTFGDKYYLIFILIIIYLCICISLCTGIIFQKNLMQLKFIPSYRLLFFKGIIGIFIITIALCISSNVPCDDKYIVPERPINDTGPPPHGIPPGPRPDYPPSDFPPPSGEPPEFMDEMNAFMNFQIFRCFFKYNNESYFDNFIGYFNSLSKRNTIGEIFILLAYFILHFISELSLILVNKFLSPIHYLISESFYTLIHLLYQIITHHFNDDPFNSDKKDENTGSLYNSMSQNEISRILKFLAGFFEFIGYMIFMEIIHLNFCGLNRDISKNIEKRAKLESISLEKEMNMDFDDINDSFENSLTYNKK